MNIVSFAGICFLCYPIYWFYEFYAWMEWKLKKLENDRFHLLVNLLIPANLAVGCEISFGKVLLFIICSTFLKTKIQGANFFKFKFVKYQGDKPRLWGCPLSHMRAEMLIKTLHAQRIKMGKKGLISKKVEITTLHYQTF